MFCTFKITIVTSIVLNSDMATQLELTWHLQGSNNKIYHSKIIELRSKWKDNKAKAQLKHLNNNLLLNRNLMLNNKIQLQTKQMNKCKAVNKKIREDCRQAKIKEITKSING